ncbi:MAG: tRNA uridine-5-carboxymethylaminomethyl(34) synthesis GTPase MnmE [Methyloceanibacter sp.]|uniref:tRNA uridine-5-carboxymethylaminomethyl(34) synthesis GTPase MnmE n=1 Tax=Methyloceanibacter sp. TaxID=1965321 RepID=UPI003D6D7C10
MIQPDTIVAPASGAGPSAIAVVRISGPRTLAVLEALAGGVPPPRRASLRDLGDPMIDRGLVLWFPAPQSFTGEDMAELQVHGSRAVIQALVDAVLAIEGTRLAEPGEFARRAFENGRLDLTEVEGLADLIAAETEAQRRQALAQAEGSLRRLYEGWRAELVKALGLMEAGLDFADEADVTADVSAKAEAIVVKLLQSIDRHLADRSGERLRDGLRIVIAGPPNVGKSSLMNALAKRDVAIVSEEAGTTRDVIEVHLDLGGLPVILSDTAGIREGTGKVEAEGVRRALTRAEDADVILWVVDATSPVWDPPARLAERQVVRALNKADISPQSAHNKPIAIDAVVSAKSGEGLDTLIARLAAVAAKHATPAAGTAALTRTRHRIELVSARDALQRFVNHDLSAELKAEELRIAARHLGRLTGAIDVEEVLAAIFAEFCIGK